MLNSMPIPGPIQMSLGMINGFIAHNIKKMPEDKLRQEIQDNLNRMQSWLDATKHVVE